MEHSITSSTYSAWSPEERIADHLAFLYGEEQSRSLLPLIQDLIQKFRQRNPHLCESSEPSTDFDQRDALLITYGDQITEASRPPLLTLTEFLENRLKGYISGVHLLPFYPYSSDDGFSVIHYRQVNPALGTWDHIARLGQHFKLMFDAVINHISRQSEWFKAFQRDEAPYRDYFIVVSPEVNLSQVVRPRALPLLTPVETVRGTRYVWTTFSNDQMDLNYANPQVLLEIIDLLLFYVEHGASIIRLDAIAYLWKEIGTTCIHLPQTHRVVKLLRAVLDAVAPNVLLITETNVPHQENIQYFGDSLPGGNRTDEAQMVYQFPLAPLVLHAFQSEQAHTLMEWVSSLETPHPGTTFFNFIASHDGIGVRPAEGLLEPSEIQALVERTLAHGGLVSYRANPDGSKSVYELNITLYDALNNPHKPDDERDIQRFIASQVIMLSLAGVPGIYFHSLIGSRNCHSCVERSGMARSINREKFDRKQLEESLSNPNTIQSRVFHAYLHLLKLRQSHPAFHPSATQKTLWMNDHVFSLLRVAEKESILCLINVSPRPQRIALPPTAWLTSPVSTCQDLISGKTFEAHEDSLELNLMGYQAMWLTSLKDL
jgi:glycosidase